MWQPAMTASSQRLRRIERARLERGFTLIEIMISIAILTILVMVAVPSMTDLIRDQRVKNATFDVYASLTFARSEAIKRGAAVDIVPTLAADWGSGWQVQVQLNNAPLKNQDAINGINILGPVGTISYQRDGRITPAAPTFVLKSSQSDAITARCVRVDLSGRPNIKVDTNHDPNDGCQ